MFLDLVLLHQQHKFHTVFPSIAFSLPLGVQRDLQAAYAEIERLKVKYERERESDGAKNRLCGRSLSLPLDCVDCILGGRFLTCVSSLMPQALKQRELVVEKPVRRFLGSKLSYSLALLVACCWALKTCYRFLQVVVENEVIKEVSADEGGQGAGVQGCKKG